MSLQVTCAFCGVQKYEIASGMFGPKQKETYVKFMRCSGCGKVLCKSCTEKLCSSKKQGGLARVLGVADNSKNICPQCNGKFVSIS